MGVADVAFLQAGGHSRAMPSTIELKVTVPAGLARLQLPAGVHRRLHHLLDKQDKGVKLSAHERQEAEGLVDLAELLSLLKLRAERKAAVA